MPKSNSNNNRRFLQFTAAAVEENHNMSAATGVSPPQISSLSSAKHQQRCFVCYNEFSPFALTTDKWETNLIKMFYSALNLPAPDDGADEDDDDAVISLPFCPPCHSKISVMASLHGQLQIIQGQFSKIRNDVVFTIVETNEKNCRKGPMDFIRQQIYDKWKDRYEDAKAKSYFDKVDGLESVVADATALSKIVPDEFAYPNSESTAGMEEFTNSLGPAVSQFGGIVKSSSTANSAANGRSGPGNEQGIASSKRPVRSTAPTSFIMYNDSMTKFREMETVFKSMSSPPMPKLIPMGSQAAKAKRLAEMGSGMQMQTAEKISNSRSPIKRTNSNSSEDIPAKFAKIRPGPPRRFGVPVKMKFQPGKRRPGRPFGWRKLDSNSPPGKGDQDGNASGRSPRKSELDNSEFEFEDDGEEPSTSQQLDWNGGDFACRLCPKIYYNISRLRRHESLCHPSVKALQCTLCQLGFSSMLAFRRHMLHQHHQSMAGMTAITCAICLKAFVKQSAFDLHMTTHEKNHHRSPASQSFSGPRTISGVPSKKKPGPKAKSKEDDLTEIPEDIGESVIENPESDHDLNNPDDSVIPSVIPEESQDLEVEVREARLKQRQQAKKKNKYFTGRPKRRRKLHKAVENSETQDDQSKNEPAEKRVIIPRKKIQHAAPVRKSLRRAESTSTPIKSETVALEKPEENAGEKPIEKSSEMNVEPVSITTSNSNLESADKSKPVGENTSLKKEIIDRDKQVEASAPATPSKITRREKSTRVSAISSSTMSQRNRLICPICGLEYPFIGLLNMHLKSHPRDETQCEDCKRQLNSYEEYRSHIVTQHKRELLPCSTCGEEFGNKNYLAGHEINHQYLERERSKGRERLSQGGPTNNKIIQIKKEQNLQTVKRINNDSTENKNNSIKNVQPPLLQVETQGNGSTKESTEKGTNNKVAVVAEVISAEKTGSNSSSDKIEDTPTPADKSKLNVEENDAPANANVSEQNTETSTDSTPIETKA